MHIPPLDAVLSKINASINSNSQLILQAPPGAGKSTYLPLKLLQHPTFTHQKILMLEPRRLAAKNIAHYIAKQLGENIGNQVGYRIRGEHKTSSHTRLEIITEGILTRMLQEDPELTGIGLIIFDEYHERNIHADVALAFCLEIQSVYRENLNLLIMSATLDSKQLCQMLPEADLITSQGRSFDVTTHYYPKENKAPLAPQVAALIQQALKQFDDNILVFLPSVSDIHKVQTLMRGLPDTIEILPLYSQLKNTLQEKAIAIPFGSHRKVVLATNIAETSITIDGISLVIDSGLVNRATFNRQTGVTKLSKQTISKASSIQRQGRAGRIQPGNCWRMWSEEQQTRLAEYDIPEIEQSDLLSLALELAHWGVVDVFQLQWLNPPPSHNLLQARQLLISMGILNEHFKITKHGLKVYQFGCSPRLAHMMIFAKSLNLSSTAALLAAIIEQPNVLSSELDISMRIQYLQENKQHNTTEQSLINNAKKYARQLECSLTEIQSQACGLLIANAYPDRIAKRRVNTERFQLANGYGAVLPDNSHFTENYIVAIDLMSFESTQDEARIFLAASLNIAQLQTINPELFIRQDSIKWDNKQQKVIAASQLKRDQLLIKSTPLTDIDNDQYNKALCEGLRIKGLQFLSFKNTDTQLLYRLRTAKANEPNFWPDYSDKTLLNELEHWLLPFFNNARKLSDLKKVNLHEALLSRLDWQKQQALNDLYPTHFIVASGSKIRLDYSHNEIKLSVRIQELFGTQANPSVGKNQLPILVEMLSPANRPIQLTKDLISFWHGSYQSVKKEMKGRYPRHYWPDDPSIAIATTRTKKKM